MHWLDTTIVSVLALGAICGAWSGLLAQLARLVGLGVSLYAAVYFHEWAARLMQEHFLRDADPRVCTAVAYLAVFLVIYLALFVLTLMLERAVRTMRLQPVNRLLGAGLGALKAGLILGAIALGMVSYPHPSAQELMQRSKLAPVLAQAMEGLIRAIPAEYKEDLQAGLDNLTRTMRQPPVEAVKGSSGN
jgi:membrane protein required for colicin V production